MKVFKSTTVKAYSPSGSLFVTTIEYEERDGEIIPTNIPPVVDATKAAPTNKKRTYGLGEYLD